MNEQETDDGITVSFADLGGCERGEPQVHENHGDKGFNRPVDQCPPVSGWECIAEILAQQKP
jgi:hypothetical protein